MWTELIHKKMSCIRTNTKKKRLDFNTREHLVKILHQNCVWRVWTTKFLSAMLDWQNTCIKLLSQKMATKNVPGWLGVGCVDGFNGFSISCGMSPIVHKTNIFGKAKYNLVLNSNLEHFFFYNSFSYKISPECSSLLKLSN